MEVVRVWKIEENTTFGHTSYLVTSNKILLIFTHSMLLWYAHLRLNQLLCMLCPINKIIIMYFPYRYSGEEGCMAKQWLFLWCLSHASVMQCATLCTCRMLCYRFLYFRNARGTRSHISAHTQIHRLRRYHINSGEFLNGETLCRFHGFAKL